MTRSVSASHEVGSHCQSPCSSSAITIGTRSGVRSAGGSNETVIGPLRVPSNSETTAEGPIASTPSGTISGSGPSCTASFPPVAPPTRQEHLDGARLDRGVGDRSDLDRALLVVGLVLAAGGQRGEGQHQHGRCRCELWSECASSGPSSSCAARGTAPDAARYRRNARRAPENRDSSRPCLGSAVCRGPPAPCGWCWARSSPCRSARHSPRGSSTSSRPRSWSGSGSPPRPLLLLLLARPRLAGPQRSDWLVVLAFGIALATMNWAIYQAIARLPLGVAVSIELLGPLTLALVLSRQRPRTWPGCCWPAPASRCSGSRART